MVSRREAARLMRHYTHPQDEPAAPITDLDKARAAARKLQRKADDLVTALERLVLERPGVPGGWGLPLAPPAGVPPVDLARGGSENFGRAVPEIGGSK